MKRLIIIPVCVLAAIFSGCHSSSKQASDSTATDSAIADSAYTNSANTRFDVDSITFNKQASSTIKCRIFIDYPCCDDSLAQSVKTTIAELLAACYLPQVNGDDDCKKAYPIYKGSCLTGQLMANFYGNGIIKYMKSAQDEQREFMDDQTSELPSYYNEINIRKGEETRKYLTYDFTEECYLGGAHGSYYYYSVNFDKRTAKPIKKAINPAKVKSMQSILRKGVMQYLKECNQDVTDANLNSFLTLSDGKTIPLPEHSPWITNDSIDFVYQQYEIAPYAVGLISFKLPIKDVEPYLTKEMKAILND